MSPDLPKVVLPDGRDCVYLTDFASNTLQLDSDVGSSLNDLICVVRVLRRCGIAVKFDIRGNHLLEREHVAVFFQPDSTYGLSQEDSEGTNIYEDSCGGDTADHAVAHLALERPPHDSLERDGVFCETTAWEHARFRDVDNADNADDIVLPRNCSLHV